MFLWTIKTIILSLVFIFLVHHLISFFKSTLTVPKIKDLVNIPREKYDTIYQTLSSSNNIDNKYNSNKYNSSMKEEMTSMKSDLKNYLKEQMEMKTTTDIASLGFGQGSSFGSEFVPDSSSSEQINSNDLLPSMSEW
jgi:hypothetical protein